MSPSAHPLLPARVQASYWKTGLWQDVTLPQILVEQAHRQPDAPLYAGDEPRTYAEVTDVALRFATFLRERGVSPEDTVVAPLVSGWEAAAVVAATSCVGARLAPLPSRASRSQLLALVAATHAAAVVISGRVLAKEGWKEALAGLRVRTVVLTDTAHAPAWASDLPDLSTVSAGCSPAELSRADTGAPFLLLSTGGTTGPCKVVMHAENAVVYAARQYAEKCALSAEDRVLSAGPFGHASGTIFTLYAPILAGASVLPVVRWDPQRTSRAVESRMRASRGTSSRGFSPHGSGSPSSP